MLPAVWWLLTFTACMMDPNADFRASRPDQVLFARARSAAQRSHLDVARMTLQTLVNTYPDSDYADKAERVLNDPRMQGCDGSEGMQFIESLRSPCESTPGSVNEEQSLFIDSN
jgi:hypothetical protein